MQSDSFHTNTNAIGRLWQTIKDSTSFVFLALLSITIAYATGVYGIQSGGIILALVFIISGLLATLFWNYRVGIYILLVYIYVMFRVATFVRAVIPFGIVVDLLLFLAIIGMLVQRPAGSLPKGNNNPFRSAIGYAILATFILDMIQMFNPGANDFGNSMTAFRDTVYLVLFYFLTYRYFERYTSIVNYTFFWIALSFVVALYGLHQEYFGLTEKEWIYLRSDSRRLELYFVWGNVRKWSFLSDPSVFGMLMAFTTIFCFVIALRKFSFKVRVGAFITAVIALVAMTTSGTRTAVGMIPVGVAFYFLMTMNNPKMIVAAGLTGLMFLVYVFGPFYGATQNRIRSTFNSDDPSLYVRDNKRDALQSYIYRKPFGSGLGMANSISERLTVTADTDSGYLRTAIDKGIVGLLVQLTLYCTLMITGIRAYYDSTDPDMKSLLAAYLAAFFALTVAAFYQDVADQKPISFLMIGVFSVVQRLGSLQLSPKNIEN